MVKMILLGLLAIIVVFLGYVSTRDGKFRYERSGVINASADKIFPYISNFKLGELWSPYDKPELKMQKKFNGTDGQAGSTMEFDGKESGSGKLTLLKLVPNQSVDINLVMLKPFRADNLVEYKLTPEGSGTRFTWIMSGDGGFMSKLMTAVIDCEKMIGGQFEEGIAKLKTVVENAK